MGPAFGRRCIPSGGVASSSNTPGILGRRALPDGRLAALGASPPFMRWLLVGQVRCGTEPGAAEDPRLIRHERAELFERSSRSWNMRLLSLIFLYLMAP